MRVLVACEFSGIVRDAFIARGHDAWSCDLLPTERPGPHLQQDVFTVLDQGWDLMIFHWPCTFLCNSGVLRLYQGGKKANGPDLQRWQLMRESAECFKRLLGAPIPRIAGENPVMHGYALEIVGQKASQSIQPYEFGEDASKRTCLWLKGLPLLQPTGYFPPRLVNGKPRWSNQTDSNQNRLGPSPDRWKLRSATYPGIAAAMADQWGGAL